MASTILNVKWTDVTLEEALAVSEVAHRGEPGVVTTWITGNTERRGRYDVDTDGVSVTAVGQIDRKLSEMRQEQHPVDAVAARRG